MHKKHASVFLVLAAVLLLTAGAIVLAQSSANFDLTWHVVSSGGGSSSSSSFHVNGTIGQAVVSPPLSSSANFVLSSGYWFVDAGTRTYLPIVRKN